MIKISKAAWDTMVSHVEGTFPKEGCGLMIGSAGVVEEAVEETPGILDPLAAHYSFFYGSDWPRVVRVVAVE